MVVFLRKGRGDAPPLLVACNMTPVVRSDYQVGAPTVGRWREIFN